MEKKKAANSLGSLISKRVRNRPPDYAGHHQFRIRVAPCLLMAGTLAYRRGPVKPAMQLRTINTALAASRTRDYFRANSNKKDRESQRWK